MVDNLEESHHGGRQPENFNRNHAKRAISRLQIERRAERLTDQVRALNAMLPDAFGENHASGGRNKEKNSYGKQIFMKFHEISRFSHRCHAFSHPKSRWTQAFEGAKEVNDGQHEGHQGQDRLRGLDLAPRAS